MDCRVMFTGRCKAAKLPVWVQARWRGGVAFFSPIIRLKREELYVLKNNPSYLS